MSGFYTKYKLIIYLASLGIICVNIVLLLNRPTSPDEPPVIDDQFAPQDGEWGSSTSRNDEPNSGVDESPEPAAAKDQPAAARGVKLVAPENGIYHGAFPDFGPFEDEVTTDRITAFTDLVEKDIAWGYFSDNWFDGIQFPTEEVETLRDAGVTPFIRLMPRSRFQDSGQDPVYTLRGIVAGEFDAPLREWARQARAVDIPLLVEFGTEMNGDWFTWAGVYNGADTTDRYGDPTQADGPEIFQDAYRHIVDIFRAEGVDNVTWFFHVNIVSSPDVAWNHPSQYYPGDAYVDWIGVSVYGAQQDGDQWVSFANIMDEHFDDVAAISPQKPVAILEFGVDEREGASKADWISDALNAILRGEYPRVNAVSYWHSTWSNDDDSMSRLRLDSSKESLDSYRSLIGSPVFETATVFRSE